MSDAALDQEETSKKGKLPLILGVVLGLVGAAGGYVVASGGLGGGGSSETHEAPKQYAKAAFVPVPPLTISLGRDGDGVRHLRFQAQLEVEPSGKSTVESLLPRVSDVLNGYLRAVELSDIEDPSALVRIRAQMLRRVQIVVGDDLVRDLLVMEFVLN